MFGRYPCLGVMFGRCNSKALLLPFKTEVLLGGGIFGCQNVIL